MAYSKITPIEKIQKTKEQLYKFLQYQSRLKRNKEGKSFKEILNELLEKGK